MPDEAFEPEILGREIVAPEERRQDGPVGALAVVPTVEARMMQIQQAPGLAEAAVGDPDEDLFQAAFGEGDEDGLDAALANEMAHAFNEPARGLPRRVPVYVPPMPVQVAQAAPAAPGGNRRRDVLAGAPGTMAMALQRRQAEAALVDAPGAVAWRPLFDLPGYSDPGPMGQAVRSLGRSIFLTMPCFARMQAECRALGRDPLGEVQVMADVGGRGPSTQGQMNAMAVWIRQNGTLIDGAQIAFPDIMPGYRPNIILAATDDESFLMVEETRERGAPMESTFIYSWRGGRQLYLDNPDARASLQRLAGDNPVPVGVRALAAPAPAAHADPVRAIPVEQPRPAAPVEQPRRAPARRAARAVAELPPPVANPELPPRVQRGQPAAQAALPAPVARENPIRALRTAGFTSCGTPDGPALRRDTSDGGHVLVLGEGGRSIALATSFSARKMDSVGTEVERTSIEGHEAAIEWADARSGQVARP